MEMKTIAYKLRGVQIDKIQKCKIFFFFFKWYEDVSSNSKMIWILHVYRLQNNAGTSIALSLLILGSYDN